MSEDITVYDLLDPEFLQRIQDDFAAISEVGSIIFDLQGNPITRPSNFTGYCRLIRSTKKGMENCIKSDAALARAARKHINEPIAPLCKSGRLTDGMAPILVGNRRIAGWGIGQVVLEEQDEGWIRSYAREIGVSDDELVDEYRKLKRIDEVLFEKIVRYLVTLSRELSETALKNYRLLQEIQKRRKSEERYHAIVENVLVGICEVSNEGILEYVNGQMAELSGRTCAELLGMDIKRLLLSKREYSSYFRGISDYCSSKKVEKNGYKFNGSLVNTAKQRLIPCHVGITTQKNLSNQVIRSTIVIIDSSAEKQALKKLKERNRELYNSKKQVDLFFDSNVFGLCIIDRLMQKVKCNPAYMVFLMKTGQVDSFKNGIICHYLEQEDYEKVFEGKVKSLELKKEFGYQLFSIRLTPISNHEKQIIQLLITIEDITHYQLKLENNLFSEKLNGVGMLASGIAHDLRNVFAVLGNSQHTLQKLLEQREVDSGSEKMQDILQVQESGLISGRKILNQLFSFSGVRTQHKDRFLLRDSVDMIVRIYTSKILEKNAEIEIDINESVMIESQESKFIQIVMNLLSNAIDAIESDGKIVIAARCKPSECVLTIGDDGEGIDEMDQRKIFKAFYSSKSAGTGLGLYSVKNIIEEFGGSIRFESERHVGTTFTITIRDSDQVKIWIQE